MGGGGQGQNGGGSPGTIGQYMAQGQPPSGFGGGVSIGQGQPAWGVGQSGGSWGVTPGQGLGPFMSGLQNYGMLLNNPTILNAIQSLLGGGAAGGGGIAGHGPLKTMGQEPNRR